MNKKMANFIRLVYEKMNITSRWQFIMVMIVFSITGSLSLFLSLELMSYLNLRVVLSPILFWPVRIIVLFIIYQLTLILVAIPFGQFEYFLRFERNFLKKFGIKI